MRITLHARRGLAAVALVVAATLTACSGGTNGVPDAGPSATTAGIAAAFPTAIEHAFGETTIDAEPARVVTIGWGDLDNALALGVTPVGYYAPGAMTDELMPWAEELVDGARPEYLGPEAELDLERVAALEPDLILSVQGHRLDEDVYGLLSAIAPTVVHPAGEESAWRIGRDAATRQIAASLGRPAEGEQLLDDLNAQLAATREAYPGLEGETGVVVLPGDGVYYAYNTADGRGEFLASLGLVLPDAVEETSGTDSIYLELSPEEVGLVDGDVVVFVTAAPQDDPVATNALFEQFDARFVSFSDADRWSITLNTPPSISYALDHLVPAIADTIDG
ncbi:iron-siderophore ABC transporter substrate-binding protein [Myceligenerans halotolerans]